MERQHALLGALVADAAGMGLHWLYDQEQIKLVEATGSLLFRQPEAAVFADKRGYFAHAARRSGQLSHYGESARIAGVVGSNYTTSEHQAAFMASFGPCGSYHGYADRPTKQLIARMLIDGEELAEPSGMDDDQMPGLCAVPGLFSAAASDALTLDAVRVISTNSDVIQSAQALHTVLTQLISGVELKAALTSAAESVDGELGELMRDALTMSTYEPLEAAQKFGLACYVKHAMPLNWYLLNHADNFESTVLDNIRCGGDNCGRSMALGSIAGVAFGVSEELLLQTTGIEQFRKPLL